jgi:hypothetical protein
MSEPGYWINETSGVLAPAVKRYLDGELEMADIPVIRAYLRQWIGSSVWDENPHQDADSARQLANLRSRVDTISTRPDLDAWLNTAIDMGMDPL